MMTPGATTFFRKITICSMENRTGSSLYELVHSNHLRYSEAHGYDYLEINDFSRYEQKSYPHFYKFDVIWEALQHSDVVMWMDFDAVYTNFSICVEDIIQPGDHIVMSKDSRGGRCRFDTGYNNGVMILRSTSEVMTLVSLLKMKKNADIFAAMQREGNTKFFDQSMMTYFLALPDYEGLVREIPAKKLQCYAPHRAEMDNAWEDGDYILHLPGMSDSERMKWLTIRKY